MSLSTAAPQPPSIIYRLEKWKPGLRAARAYCRGRLGRDIVAGLVLCALLAPQGMAYAELAGLPAIADFVAMLHFFERNGRPYAAILGRREGLEGYHDISRYPEATQIPGLLMIRWDAPLFFADANIFRHKLRTKDKIVRYGQLETIDSRHFYPALESVVEAFHEEYARTTTAA